ncbi:MAG: hypothetical protein EBY22_08905 [Gammaproteobacteria bacterium]|jgi:hypothetical protein|nr:hypothetical protein [Gammaproteobacteria bacterium]
MNIISQVGQNKPIPVDMLCSAMHIPRATYYRHLESNKYADNGPSMKSHTVAQLLEHLGVAKTHNRPYTSNDNPFSE